MASLSSGGFEYPRVECSALGSAWVHVFVRKRCQYAAANGEFTVNSEATALHYSCWYALLHITGPVLSSREHASTQVSLIAAVPSQLKPQPSVEITTATRSQVPNYGIAQLFCIVGPVHQYLYQHQLHPTQIWMEFSMSVTVAYTRAASALAATSCLRPALCSRRSRPARSPYWRARQLPTSRS